MRLGAYVAIGLLLAAAACAASGATDESQPDAGVPDGDSGASSSSLVDAAVPASEDAAPDVELDAARPLVCGDAGFCETQLPRSDLGLPLSLRSVWVVSPTDVWSVSIEGFVLHHDGTRWTVEYRANHELYAVWATPTSVWIGGERGLLLHRSATGEWSLVDAGHLQPIRAVYGSGDDDVWFTRDDSAVAHYDGSTVTTYPTDVPDLRITTVFGRPGFGTYAAGHVPRPLVGGVPQDLPYVFELATTGIVPFNTSLTAKKGFVPRSGYVTDSPDEGQRVLLTGYVYSNRKQPVGSLDLYTFYYSFFGSNSVVSINPLGKPTEPMIDFVDAGTPLDETRPTYPALVYAWNDILILWSVGFVYHWNGSPPSPYFAEGYSSLAMGAVTPAAIFGAHTSSTNAWIVGDGFALRRATP